MILFFVFGALLGSFLNAWILRTHEGISIWKGRSHCPSCGRMLLWRDLIPIVSFIALKRRCRWCNAPIRWQYPMIELWMGIAFFVIGQRYGDDWMAVGSMLFVIFFLTFVFVSDLRFMEIPLHATLAPALAFFLFSAIREPDTAVSMMLGAGSIAGFFLFQYLISRGEWIGLGDVWLGIFMGVVLGYVGMTAVFFGLMISYILAAIFAVFLLLFFKKNRKTRVPFGVFLALGTVLALEGAPILFSYFPLQ